MQGLCFMIKGRFLPSPLAPFQAIQDFILLLLLGLGTDDIDDCLATSVCL